MKKLTLSLLCAGLITTTAIAEDICNGTYQAQNYEEAAECYIKQLKKERTLNNLESIGFSYVHLGRYKEALPYLQEAEKKAQTSSDYKLLYSYLGSVYGYMGDTVQELAYKMKYLDLSLKLGVRESIGNAYGNLGAYYYGQNQNQKALEYYEKALEYKEESESATTYGNMASAYSALENDLKAEEMYQKAIEVDQESGQHLLLGLHKMELGLFYFLHDRNSEARAMLADALVISRDGGNIRSQSSALSILARIDYREGYINEGKEKASEALSLAKQSGDTRALKDAHTAWNLVNGK